MTNFAIQNINFFIVFILIFDWSNFGLLCFFVIIKLFNDLFSSILYVTNIYLIYMKDKIQVNFVDEAAIIPK